MHIDGYNLLPYLTGEAKESPRKFFFYISDDGDILAIRMGDWKMVLMEQRAKQLMCWFEPFVKLRAPKMFNLRRDPFERADENSNTYWDWVISHAYLLYGMQAIVAQQIEDFVKFPPRQKPAAFNLDAVLGKSRTQAAAVITSPWRSHSNLALSAFAATELTFVSSCWPFGPFPPFAVAQRLTAVRG